MAQTPFQSRKIKAIKKLDNIKQESIRVSDGYQLGSLTDAYFCFMDMKKVAGCPGYNGHTYHGKGGRMHLNEK